MTTYDVAVMNYPLFDKHTDPVAAAARLVSSPWHTDPGSPWPTSLYIHIPFCGSLCDFCVYNRQLASHQPALVEAFAKALVREVEHYARSIPASRRSLDTVFVGGGTPTVLSLRQLEALFRALHRHWDLRHGEITVECHPLNASREKLALFKEYGVTRISTGVQSFQDSLRRRYHIALSAGQVECWLDMAQAMGFQDVSLDLMYGFPGMSEEDVLQDVQRALDRKMGHISLYKLAVFAYTTLYRRLRGDPQQVLPDAATCYRQFVQAHRLLLHSGYILQSAQEYGQAGKTVRFWDATYDGFGDNLALGVSSFGYVNGYCYQNATSVNDYIAWIQQDRLPIERISPRITAEQLRERAVVMGFRRGYVLREPFRRVFGVPVETPFADVLARLRQEGLVQEQADRYVLTEEGLYHQGNVSAAFMISVFRHVSALKKKHCIGCHEMP